MQCLYCVKVYMDISFKVIDKIRISIAYGNKHLRIFFFFQTGAAEYDERGRQRE